MSEWVPVVLGDVRIGDIARTIPEKVSGEGRYKNVLGQIVGIRSGLVTLQVLDRWVNFFPDQLEREVRPE